MDETGNDDTFGGLPTLGRPIPAEQESGGPARTWTDEDAERETLKRPVSPEELTLAKRYKVLRRLGEGGMGSVWLTEDLKLDRRKVTIKMLPAVLAGKKGAYRQVKQEALMAIKLSHPNIATVRAFEEEDGNPFLVMDYIEGQGLDDILAEKGKLSEEETLRLLTPVAAALDYAHAQGVVHRDVKPGNVIVRKDGTPFVLDFGIAREIQETMTRVTGKFSSGTLLYMSPEQLRGRAPKAAQDVYSFAAMAYECLTGQPPFYRGAVGDQIKNEPPEELPEEIEESLRRGVMAGLAKVPERRPQNCTAVFRFEEPTVRMRREKHDERIEIGKATCSAHTSQSELNGGTFAAVLQRREAMQADWQKAEPHTKEVRKQVRPEEMTVIRGKEARGNQRVGRILGGLAISLVLLVIALGATTGSVGFDLFSLRWCMKTTYAILAFFCLGVAIGLLLKSRAKR